mgnify:CR=1 FL=1
MKRSSLYQRLLQELENHPSYSRGHPVVLTQLLIMLQGNLEASHCALVGFQGPQCALGRSGVLSVLIIVIRGASVFSQYAFESSKCHPVCSGGTLGSS